MNHTKRMESPIENLPVENVRELITNLEELDQYILELIDAQNPESGTLLKELIERSRKRLYYSRFLG